MSESSTPIPADNRRRFSYDDLDPGIAAKIKLRATQIRKNIEAAVNRILEVGRDLLFVRDTLPHGSWLPWLEAEGISDDTAYNMIRAYEQFGRRTIKNAVPTVLYLLARPSVPQEARDEAIERADKGERITVEKANEIVEAAKFRIIRDLAADAHGDVENAGGEEPPPSPSPQESFQATAPDAKRAATSPVVPPHILKIQMLRRYLIEQTRQAENEVVNLRGFPAGACKSIAQTDPEVVDRCASAYEALANQLRQRAGLNRRS